MPRHDSEQVYEYYQPTPATLEGFRQFVTRNSDRCKGIAYFDCDSRRVNLTEIDGASTVGNSTENVEMAGGDVTIGAVRKIGLNGSAKGHVEIVTSNGQSKRQKAE